MKCQEVEAYMSEKKKKILFIDNFQGLFDQNSSTRAGLWEMFLLMLKPEQH